MALDFLYFLDAMPNNALTVLAKDFLASRASVFARCALRAGCLFVLACTSAQASEEINDEQTFYQPEQPVVESPGHSHSPLRVDGEEAGPAASAEAVPGEVADATVAGSARPEHPPLADVLETASQVEVSQPFTLLGGSVAAGQMNTLQWSPQDIFEGIPLPTPVLVANGTRPGPVLCMTGAVHGDEINSIETIRRVMHGLDPQKLSGTVVAVPIVNQMGFRRNSRYLPDRRDLNRYFPGSSDGSSASRIAYSLFNDIVLQCDALVDLHTGSFHRTNIPQLRADLNDESVRVLVEHFGNIVVLHSEGSAGMLRREATLAGVPTVTVEAGESLRIQDEVIVAGVKHIRALMTNLEMIERSFFFGDPQPTYMASRWLRAEAGGIFISRKSPGEKVSEGELLGTITDPITNRELIVRAEFSGKIIGMAMNQVVLPGYAIYHVGMDASLEEEQPVEVDDAHLAASEPPGQNGVEIDGVDGAAVTRAETRADPAQSPDTQDGDDRQPQASYDRMVLNRAQRAEAIGNEAE